MERRDFLKLTVLTGASSALAGCNRAEERLIRFIPDQDLLPGVANWKPGVCTLCPAGCGLRVRVMAGDAEVVRNGRSGLLRTALAKKLEGNPNHPLNRGKLCPRGQAGVHLTYHPDRLRHPLQRAGNRSSAQFEEISWEAGLKLAAEKLATARKSSPSKLDKSSYAVFLTRPLLGRRQALIEAFMAAFAGPPPIRFEFFDESVLRRANLASFGHWALPSFDFANSNYVISFGADFLGTWNSPVAQAITFGEMRQGRPGVRGKFVQVEQRVSQTGANADEWIYAAPGAEGLLALGLAHVLIREKLRPARAAGAAGAAWAGWVEGLPDYSPDRTEPFTGVPKATVERLARELAARSPAVAVIGGPALAHTNGFENALAVNALNALLGTVEKPGGMFFTPQPPLAQPKSRRLGAQDAGPLTVRELAEAAHRGHPPDVLLLYDANPVFASPPAWKMREALERVPFIISFGSFLDETSELADLVLPDHSPLESWMDHVPESGTAEAVVSLAAPALPPLYDTRPMPDTLLELSRRLADGSKPLLPWDNFEAMLRQGYARLRATPGSIEEADNEDDFWQAMLEQGGWWGKGRATKAAPQRSRPVRWSGPEFEGSEQEYPFYFQPFASQAFLEGSLAHLPWLQEMPDALSTVMWGSWVEINPTTAERLKIQTADLVEVTSLQGSLRAPAVISPGIAPDVIAMPVGQGHSEFSRYASGRGANPISILADTSEHPFRDFPWAATRVKVTRVGEGKLAMFAGGLSRFPHQIEPR